MLSRALSLVLVVASLAAWATPLCRCAERAASEASARGHDCCGSGPGAALTAQPCCGAPAERAQPPAVLEPAAGAAPVVVPSAPALVAAVRRMRLSYATRPCLEPARSSPILRI